MLRSSPKSAEKRAASLSEHQVDAGFSSGRETPHAEIAQAVGAMLSTGELSPKETELAIDVLTVLAKDIQEKVRAAVAKSVMNSSLLPRALACQLANDVESVALPLLQAATVLSDSDLIDVVKQGNLKKQLAIAKRTKVASRVVQALLDVDRSEVTHAVVENDGSEITEAQYHTIIERAPDEPGLQTAVANRIQLPLSVTARLIDLAAEGILDTLVTSQGIPSFLADQMVDCAREAILTEQATDRPSDDSLTRFASHLRSRGKLTESLLLRTMLEGYVPFFEAAFAALANVPLRNARTIMYYGGSDGLRKLFDRTTLSDVFYLPLQVGVRFIRQVREERQIEAGMKWPFELSEKLIQMLVQVDRRFQYGTIDQMVSRFRYELANERPT